MCPPKRARISTKPLSYESLKTVLQHLEANLRFQLSNRVPSIRVAEKSVPLKIDRLKFSPMSVTVNETTYNLGIYRKHRFLEMSKWIRQENEGGGVQHDLDQYGIPDLSADLIMTPGDVFISGISIVNEMIGITDDQYIQYLEERLRDLQQQLTETSDRAYSSFLEQMMDCIRSKLQFYYYRRSNVLPHYDNFIQLTIETPHGKQVERIKNNVKLCKAFKSLNKKLFGNRRHIVNVMCLDIFSYDHKIIRLPFDLKLKIRELNALGNMNRLYKALSSIIEDSSYPLNCLKLTCDNAQQLEHTVVNSAATLVLFWQTHNDPLLPVLLNLKNRVAHVSFFPSQFSNDHRVLLVQNWLETGREVGTCFSFEIEQKKTVTDFIGLIKERFHSAFIGERCAVLQMNTFSELKVSYKEDTNRRGDRWILQMEVLPIGPSTSTE